LTAKKKVSIIKASVLGGVIVMKEKVASVGAVVAAFFSCVT